MKKFLVLFLTVLFLLIPFTVFAEDAEKMVSIPESKLTANQKAELTVKDAGNWIGLGKELGTAIDSSLGALTNRANEFANTRVGVFTMFVVAYKIIGTDLIQVLVGVPLLIIWIFFFYRNCVSRRVLVKKEGKIKTYETVHNNTDGETQFVYALILLVGIGICMMIIFI